MLKPIANLYIKGENYRKTILFNVENLSLVMDDTDNVEEAKNIIFNFQILEPLNPDELKSIHYEDGNYEADLYVPVFNEETEHWREDYLFGRPTQSMEYVKYPTMDGQDAYSVTEIHYGAYAGTDEKGDVINIYINFFSNFLEGEQVEKCMEDSSKARKLIPTVKNDKRLDVKIEEINDERAKLHQTPLQYRYHMYGGTSILLDLNLKDLLWSSEPFESNSQVIDLSIFDMISTHMNWELEYSKKDLLKAQKEGRTIQIILNHNQVKFLREIFIVSDATWKKYQKLGIFKVV